MPPTIAPGSEGRGGSATTSRSATTTGKPLVFPARPVTVSITALDGTRLIAFSSSTGEVVSHDEG